MASPFPGVFFTRGFLHVLILLIASFSLGVGIAYPSPTIAALTLDFALTPFEIGTFGALTSLTAVAGPLLTNPILKAFGRRGTVRFIALLFIVSWISILCSPYNFTLLHLHRAIIGLACGGVSSVIPMYIMEISAVDLRSICGSMHQFGISFAIFLTNLIGVWFSWRDLAYFFLAISAILAVAVSFVPEPALGHSAAAPLSESLSSDGLCGTHLSALLIGIGLMFFQQVSGINAVLTNLASLLNSKYGPALAASAQCIAVVCCISLIDRLGRKVAWCVSLFGSSVSMLLMGFSFVVEWGRLGVLAAFAFQFFFCFGLGPIPWFLPPEMFPDRLRPVATSILSSTNWILSATVIFVYPLAVNAFGPFLVLTVFGIVLASGGVFGMKVLNGKREQMLLEGEEARNGFVAALASD
jgi:MFS family permease